MTTDTDTSSAEVQRLRLELRQAESRARSLRRRLEEAGGIRHRDREPLTRRVLEFLDRDPSLEFAPVDVRDGIGVDGDVSSVLRSLALQDRIVRTRRGIYRSAKTGEEPATQ